MNKEVKICVATGNWWACENMDLNAPITEVGTAYLFNDGTTYFANENENKLPFDCRWATEEEKVEYAHKKGYVYVGDEVVVVKGRKIPKGTTKVVKNFSRYYVPNTYKKCYTDYIHFTDGTKTNIENVRVIGFENVEYLFEYSNSVFYVGGRR